MKSSLRQKVALQLPADLTIEQFGLSVVGNPHASSSDKDKKAALLLF
tara:strand:+ start:8549 stop:8689 length:141 start_codon:yes stop_codon:yes gene_type:complete